MSILIELEPAEMSASSAFSNNAEIIAISVTSASYSCPDSFPQEFQAPLVTSINFNPLDTSVQVDSMRATTSFEYLISTNQEQKESQVIVRIQCVLSAIYQLASEYKPLEAELKSFHKANVVFNCWPFFRELVLNAASRMNIPLPPVPFVRVQIRQSEITSAAITQKRARKR